MKILMSDPWEMNKEAILYYVKGEDAFCESFEYQEGMTKAKALAADGWKVVATITTKQRIVLKPAHMQDTPPQG